MFFYYDRVDWLIARMLAVDGNYAFENFPSLAFLFELSAVDEKVWILYFHALLGPYLFLIILIIEILALIEPFFQYRLWGNHGTSFRRRTFIKKWVSIGPIINQGVKLVHFHARHEVLFNLFFKLYFTIYLSKVICFINLISDRFDLVSFRYLNRHYKQL